MNAYGAFVAEHDLGSTSIKRVEISHPVIWGGGSQIRTAMRMISTALAFPGWEYFTYISDSDMPMRPPTSMMATLAADAKAGVKNFVYYDGDDWTEEPRFLGLRRIPRSMLTTRRRPSDQMLSS